MGFNSSKNARGGAVDIDKDIGEVPDTI